ncbi:hypothetical protein N0M98_26540 [Paenibacillus doosanensis]|uniref:hypothetical protein n=1 Tax=Paenibacillus doosanensis TaxID=1229154 RepID=UPI00217F99FD|nr:hypothetical protein [Paenibacillus doosanensis]MCS7463669.1 hypothetical protein [Paenibacillus doosanensis]
MKRKSNKQSLRARSTALLCTLAVCTTLVAGLPTASAGKPGVFIANDTYFTLENASFSAGADSSALQFSLKMHNGSGSSIDFNGYGVQIVDSQGNSFPAKLTSKQSARVNAGQDQQFSFVSQMGKGADANDLKVHLFAWDSGSPSFMRSIGDLPVSSATPSASGLNPAQLMIVSLKDVDADYSQDALVAMRLGQSYPVTENGTQYLYTDLYVRNAGSASFQLPSGLLFRLKGPDSLTYGTSVVGGSQETLLPDKLTKLRLRTAVPESADIDPFVLEAVHTDTAGETILGSVPLSGTTAAVPLGQEQPYSLYGTDNGLKIKAEQSVAIKQAEGVLLQTTVSIHNTGSATVTLPTLTASYQLGKESLDAAVQDVSVRTGFLTPDQTATYQYSVVLPDGIDPNTVKLALKEAASSTSSSSSTGSSSGSSSSSSNNSSSSGSSNSSSGSNSNSSGSSSSSSGSGSSSSGSSSSTSSTKSNTASSGSSSADKYPVILIDLKGIQQTDNAGVQAKPYTFDTPMVFAPNGLIDKNLDVSLVEMHMHENEEFGYKTVIAKYKLTNRGASTLSVPDIGTELVNSEGLAFSGTKQSNTAETIMPNTSYVISYSYMLPTSETGQNLALNIIDPKTAAPNKLSIGTYQVAVQRESTDNVISFYPFKVTFNSYAIASLYDSGYVYQLKLGLTVDRMDSVIVDQNFSKMEFELVNGQGVVMGSQSFGFTGASKLTTGDQKITFSNLKTEQFDNELTINVYETIETPSGTVRRLVKQLKED